MPAKSGPQYRAMQAAAHGNSTLDIPKSVGQDFVDATPPDKRSQWSKHAKSLAKKRQGRK